MWIMPHMELADSIDVQIYVLSFIEEKDVAMRK